MKKILLLDDNDDYLEILELLLGKKYIIKSCTEVEHIPRLITVFEPHLIIVDYFLGLYNSNEVLNSLRSAKAEKAIPFILFSGVHDIEKRAVEIGATGYINKPSSTEYIRKYIDDILK